MDRDINPEHVDIANQNRVFALQSHSILLGKVSAALENHDGIHYEYQVFQRLLTMNWKKGCDKNGLDMAKFGCRRRLVGNCKPPFILLTLRGWWGRVPKIISGRVKLFTILRVGGIGLT